MSAKVAVVQIPTIVAEVQVSVIETDFPIQAKVASFFFFFFFLANTSKNKYKSSAMHYSYYLF